MLNCFTKNSLFHIYQQLSGSRSPSWITSLRINHPLPYQLVKVRSLDYTIVVVALWKVLCDQQLIHLVCQSWLASWIFPIFYLRFSYPHVLFLPLVFQTRVTDKTQIPLQTKQGQKKHRQRIDPFYSVQIFDLMHNAWRTIVPLFFTSSNLLTRIAYKCHVKVPKFNFFIWLYPWWDKNCAIHLWLRSRCFRRN
jgi:hypothetical protein